MLVVGAFQALEITGMVILVGLGAFLARGTMRRLDERNPQTFRAAVGIAVGLIASLIVLILMTDLIPDPIEAASRPLLVAAIGVMVLLVAVGEFIDRPRNS